MNLKILNFQSIKEIDLDISGFVVIIGKSNSGKSSIRRAINSLFFNDWDKAFIRNGTKKTELLIEHESISIKLTKPNNSYEVNGDIFPKVGIKVPDEISNLGIKLFETEAESVNLIAPSQLDPLFMIAYSDQINTRILNKIFNVQKYRLASAKAKKDNDDNSRDMKTLKSEISDNKAEHSLELSLLKKALEIKRLIELTDKIDELTSVSKSMIKLKNLINVKIDILTCTDKLISIKTLSNLLVDILDIQSKIDKTALQMDITENFISICNINIVINASEDLSNIKKLLTNNISKNGVLLEIQSILNQTAIIDNIISHLNNKTLIEDVDMKISLVDSVILLVLEVNDIKTKIKTIGNFINYNNSIISTNDKISEIDVELLDLQNKIKLVPVCKCCGSQLHLS